MANIVRSGGGGGHEFIEIGAVASSYNGIDVKVNIVLKDDVWVTASTGEYLSFSFPANGTGQCKILKDCTVSYASCPNKSSNIEFKTARYSAGDIVGGKNYYQQLLVVLVHAE